MGYYYVYIIGNEIPTLYIGVTSNLIKRVYEHKHKIKEGFSSYYNINKLLYYEVYEDINVAISREKQLKHWKRNWKMELILTINPDFKDLYSEIV